MGINCRIPVEFRPVGIPQQADFYIVEVAPRSASRVPLQVTQESTHKEGLLCMTQAQLPNANRLAKPLEINASTAREVIEPLAAIALNAEASLRWLTRTKPDVREAVDALRAIVRAVERASEALQQISVPDET
jgi:C4-dicarboxylate-specific signal transduction histidine kinase